MNVRRATEQPPMTPHDDGRRTSAPSLTVDPRFEVGDDHRLAQRCVRSRAAFVAGETLIAFEPLSEHPLPSRMTVQVSEREHVTLWPVFLELINHGCDPNVFFDVERRQLVALRAIEAGEELAFFYPSTEWVMASPFDCRCGAARCLGRVEGASQLPPDALRGQRLAPHIERLLARQKGAAG